MENAISVDASSDIEESLSQYIIEELRKIDRIKDPIEITAIRGRLISKIKKEIKKIKSNPEITEENQKELNDLETYLDTLLLDHRMQISSRYQEEFINKRATISSVVTMLPKSVALSAIKVSTCIDELKQSKTNKERIYKTIELLKSIGLLIATPEIYAVKFVAANWYLLLLLLLAIKLPKIKKWKQKQKEKKEEGQNPELQPEEELEPNSEMNQQPEGQPELNPNVGLQPGPQKEPEPTPQPEQKPQQEPQPQPGPAPSRDGIPNPSFIETPDTSTQLDLSSLLDIVPDGMPVEDVQSVNELITSFLKYIESRGYKIVEGTGITIVRSAQEFAQELAKDGTLGHLVRGVTDEEQLTQIYKEIRRYGEGIVWVDETGRDLLFKTFYFDTVSDFAQYVINGNDTELLNQWNSYLINGGEVHELPQWLKNLTDELSSIDPNVSRTVGESGLIIGLGILLKYGLDYAIQYLPYVL